MKKIKLDPSLGPVIATIYDAITNEPIFEISAMNTLYDIEKNRFVIIDPF